MFIDDTPTRNMLQITASARRIRRRNHVGLILVDYIQLVDSEDSTRQPPRADRQDQPAAQGAGPCASDSRDRAIAVEPGGRKPEDKKPRMADLRESGAIEQDADIVLLLASPRLLRANDQPGVAEARHRQESKRRDRHLNSRS